MKTNKNLKIILVILIIGIILLNGCQKTKYVCFDGSTVSSASQCSKEEYLLWKNYIQWYDRQATLKNVPNELYPTLDYPWNSMEDYANKMINKAGSSGSNVIDLQNVAELIVRDIYQDWEFDDEINCLYVTPKLSIHLDKCPINWLFNYKRGVCGDYARLIASLLIKADKNNIAKIRILSLVPKSDGRHGIIIVEHKFSNTFFVINWDKIYEGTIKDVWERELSKNYNGWFGIYDNVVGYCNTQEECREIIDSYNDIYSQIPYLKKPE